MCLKNSRQSTIIKEAVIFFVRAGLGKIKNPDEQLLQLIPEGQDLTSPLFL